MGTCTPAHTIITVTMVDTGVSSAASPL